MTNQQQEIIEKWISGTASFEETEQIWADALADAEILEYMETLAGTKKILEEKAARIHSLNSNSIKQKADLRMWIAAAAVVLISVIGSLLIKISSDPYQIGINTIDLVDLEASKTTRSGDGYLNAMDSLLSLGVKATIDGKKKNAISFFDELVSKFPNTEFAGVAQINLGIIQFNDGKFEMALENFELALKKPLSDDYVIEKAMWFKVYSLINLKKLEQARTSAFEVYQRDGVYHKQAFVLIKRIDQELIHKTFEDDYVLE